jgi:hypothetical protein
MRISVPGTVKNESTAMRARRKKAQRHQQALARKRRRQQERLRGATDSL